MLPVCISLIHCRASEPIPSSSALQSSLQPAAVILSDNPWLLLSNPTRRVTDSSSSSGLSKIAKESLNQSNIQLLNINTDQSISFVAPFAFEECAEGVLVVIGDTFEIVSFPTEKKLNYRKLCSYNTRDFPTSSSSSLGFSLPEDHPKKGSSTVGMGNNRSRQVVKRLLHHAHSKLALVLQGEALGVLDPSSGQLLAVSRFPLEVSGLCLCTWSIGASLINEEGSNSSLESDCSLSSKGKELANIREDSVMLVAVGCSLDPRLLERREEQGAGRGSGEENLQGRVMIFQLIRKKKSMGGEGGGGGWLSGEEVALHLLNTLDFDSGPVSSLCPFYPIAK
jgi:hypothetical protein